MKQTIYEEMGGSYSVVGDYRLPDLAVSGEEFIISPWGQRHLLYLRQHRRISYVNLLTTGRLPAYLAVPNITSMMPMADCAKLRTAMMKSLTRWHITPMVL